MWKANVSRNRGGKDKTIREVHKDAEQKLAEFQSLVVSAVSQPGPSKKCFKGPFINYCEGWVRGFRGVGLVFYSGEKGWVLLFLEKKGGWVSFKYYFKK